MTPTNGRGYERLRHIPPLFNLLRAAHKYVHWDQDVTQNAIKSGSAKRTRLRVIRNHQQVNVTISSAITTRTAAEKDHLLQVRRVHGPADDLAHQIVIHAEHDCQSTGSSFAPSLWMSITSINLDGSNYRLYRNFATIYHTDTQHASIEQRHPDKRTALSRVDVDQAPLIVPQNLGPIDRNLHFASVSEYDLCCMNLF